MVWFDNEQARAEGWGMWSRDGDITEPVIERLDDAEIFAGDFEAWVHVIARADAGSAYHKAALDFIRQRNSNELLRMYVMVRSSDHLPTD